MLRRFLLPLALVGLIAGAPQAAFPQANTPAVNGENDVQCQRRDGSVVPCGVLAKFRPYVNIPVGMCYAVNGVCNSPVTPFSVGIYSANQTSPGVGYAPGDLVVPNVAAPVVTVTAANLIVASTQVVALPTIAAAGTGGTPGAATLTTTTPTGTQAQIGVTIGAGGTISSVNSIVVAGQFVSNPTTLSAEPVTGGGLTGAQLNFTSSLGVAFLNVQPSGATGGGGNYNSIYSITPTGISQLSTTGSGSGLVMSLTFAPLAAGILPPNQASGTGTGGNVWTQCLGFGSCANIGTATENTAYGWNTLNALVAGHNNTAIGDFSEPLATALTNSTAVGSDSIRNCISGSNNTVMGASAGAGATNCTYTNSVIIGYQAGLVISSAATNTLIGLQAGNHITTANSNTIVGASAGQAIAGGSGGNALFGLDAGQNTTGSQNTIVGTNSGQTITSGSNNLILGFGVDFTGGTTTGSRNILFGTNTNCLGVAATNDFFGLCESTTGAYLISGNLTAAAPEITMGGPMQLGGPYSAAGTAIPACSATYTRAEAYVSDATSPTYHGTYTSGGAVGSPVFCNGTNWLTSQASPANDNEPMRIAA